jgi:hypothetical protein
MVTLVEAELWAFRLGPETETGGGAGELVAVAGSVAGATGSGVVAVVVGVAVVAVVSVVVPTSCAAEMAGTAQIAAKTSIPLARALAPITTRILRFIDS